MTTAEAKERLGSLFWIAILIRRGEATKEQEELLDEIIAELLALDAQHDGNGWSVDVGIH